MCMSKKSVHAGNEVYLETTAFKNGTHESILIVKSNSYSSELQEQGFEIGLEILVRVCISTVVLGTTNNFYISD